MTDRFTIYPMSARFAGHARRAISALIVLLFAWQIAAPMAAEETQSCTMQCCRRTHGKKTCSCGHSRGAAGGPAFSERSCPCGGDAVAAATFAPLALHPATSGPAMPRITSPRRQAESFARLTLSPSSNSFQRPPPAL